MSPVIGAARTTDLPAVVQLLQASGLPHRDLTAASLAHFLVAKRGDALLGVVGLEPLGSVGLLRSLAVSEVHRGRGLGVALTHALERHARGLGIEKLYLLTTTADRFFGRLGYAVLPRDAAPPAIQVTIEYRELCSSTAVCMVKNLERAKERAMPSGQIARPGADEYAPYFARYIEQVADGDVIDLLRRQVDETAALVSPVGEQDAGFRYAEGKWSIKEVVAHVADTERIMAYRALCFARGETASLPGFDENEYVARSKIAGRALRDIVAEFQSVRAATVTFFAGLDEEELLRRGTANNRPYSVRALAYVVAGHERHHAKILAERYLPGLPKR